MTWLTMSARFFYFANANIVSEENYDFFLMIDEIHLSYLFFSLTMQLTWTSASVLIAKYMLELFANVGIAWFMTINYSELIRADDGHLYFHVRAARLYR